MANLLERAESYESASPHFPLISRSVAEKSLPRLAAMTLFSDKSYLRMHPDVGAHGIDPYFHALFYGAAEGRALFDREQVARSLGRASIFLDDQATPPPTYGSLDDHFSAFRKRVPAASIYVSSLGNIFMKEIAEDIAVDLRRAGIDVFIRDETSDMTQREPLSIVVAPHEFFTLGDGKSWMRDEVIESSFVYNTEQLQTPWFAKSLPAILASPGVFDISPQVAHLLGEAGLPAMHLEPGAALRTHWLEDADLDHPLVSALPARAKSSDFGLVPWSERPIDISFFGSESDRRESFLARNASVLAKFSAFIYCRRQSHGVIRDQSEGQSLTRIAGHVAGHSKISLNLHRDEFSYFEWHRIVRQGMASGSLVVTDPCLSHPRLKPGEHFFQEDVRHIPNLLEWLVFDVDGRNEAQRVLKNTARLLSNDEDNFVRTASILSFLEEHMDGVLR